MSPELERLIREGVLISRDTYPARARRDHRKWVTRVRAFLVSSGSGIHLQLTPNRIAEDLAKLKQIVRPAGNRRKGPRTVFVVHGRDEAIRNAMFAFLRSLDLEPMEWSAAVRVTRTASPFNGEVLEKAFEVAQAVLVILTPDDLGKLRPRFITSSDGPSEQCLTGQPRLNVIFEAGMAFGRHPKRTILVEIGVCRPISDLAGRNTVRFDGSVRKRKELINRLAIAGCRVNDKGVDWTEAGMFPKITL